MARKELIQYPAKQYVILLPLRWIGHGPSKMTLGLFSAKCLSLYFLPYTVLNHVLIELGKTLEGQEF